MNKAEKDKIKEAMRLIMDGEGFDKGMIILGDLCDVRTAFHLLDTCTEVVDLRAISHNSVFSVKSKVA
jgi:hypothetical protein